MPKETVFTELEHRLIEVIPHVVGACEMAEPAYCLRVYYDSMDTPEEEYATRLRLLKASLRVQAVATRGNHAPDGIWMADNTDDSDIHGPNIFLKHDPQTLQICGEIFQRIVKNEGSTLRELRRTIQRVCRQLNQLDWTTVRSVTDDFVVFPADGSHTFYDDYGDLVASVPAEQIELLRQRGYLGPADRLAQL
jgi:hypothetical protein